MKKNELAELVARAESHLTAGRIRQAKRAFQQILAKYPDSTESHFQLAILLHDENNLEGAVTHFLENREALYDLILVADVFVYIGDLRNTFQLVFTALRESGLFAFSVEATPEAVGDDDCGYSLNSTRRYTHTESCVRQLATETGFVEPSIQHATLRMQAGEEVAGRIIVLQKNNDPTTRKLPT